MDPLPAAVDRAGLEVIDRAGCMRLLAAGGVGRVAVGGAPPLVRPVNFVLDGVRIVIRTGDGALWRSALARPLATFEIDGSRNVDHLGWSVIATGTLSTVVADPRTLALPLRAWAPHGRDRFVAIEVDEISGRRLTGRT